LITLAFCVGLALSFQIDNLSFKELIIFIAISVFVSFCFSFGKRLWSYMGLIILFLILGFGVGARCSSDDLSSFENKDTFFYGHINTIKEGGEWNKVILDLNGVKFQDSLFIRSGKVLLYIKKGKMNFSKSDSLFCSGKLISIQNKDNPGEFNSALYWRSKGVRYISFLEENQLFLKCGNESFIFKKMNYLQKSCADLLQNRIHNDFYGIAKALLLGDKSSLDTEDYRSFGNAGGMHLLAVSGLHIGILLECILFVFLLFPRILSRKRAFLFTLIILWFYAFLTGMSASVVRAVFMFSLLVLGRMLERHESGLNMLALSAFVLLLINPLYLLDLGFQLSYLAMFGIYLYYPKIASLYNFENKWIQMAWKGTAMGISAQLATAPLTLYFFHQFPNYFVLTNLLILILANGIMITGLLSLVFHFVPLINILLASCFSLLLYLLILGVNSIDQIPFSVAYGFNLKVYQVVLCFSVLILLCFHVNRRWVILLKGSLCFIGILFLVLNRYSSLNSEKLFCMNTNYPLVVLRKNGENHCFVEDSIHVKKSDYLLSQFNKVYPGPLVYHCLNKKWNAHAVAFNFDIEKNGKGIRMVLNNKKIFFRTSYASNGIELASFDTSIVLPQFTSAKEEYSLEGGPFIIDF
jgi:competence protein ComEC